MNDVLLVAKGIIVLLGFVVALQGVRAARRERSQRLLLTAGGFSLLSVGSVLEGLCYDVFDVSLFVAGTVQSGLVGAGMILIVMSLFMPGSAA